MGKVIFNLNYGGEVYQDAPYNTTEASGAIYNFWYRNGLDVAGKYKFEGPDFLVDIDIKPIKSEMDWNTIQFPDPRIFEIIGSMKQIRSCAEKLRRIENEINYVSSDTIWKLSSLAMDSIHLINSLQISDLLENISWPGQTITDINYAVEKKSKDTLLYEIASFRSFILDTKLKE
ncbi:MAG TPA: hypothetical protein PLK63_08870 [Catalimonadaceae bacterium]|nr:hypothetical protein [Catalimonadaceae bacterium]